MASGEATAEHRPPVEIRAFQPEDYPALVDLGNAIEPEHPGTIEEWRHEDEEFAEQGYPRTRYVAVDPRASTVVGEAEYGHMPWAFDPGRYTVWIGVHPDWRSRGIGRAMYERVFRDFRDRKTRQLRTWTQESRLETVAFLTRRGFRELHRSWESRLDLRTFDPSAFTKYAEPPPGISVVTLAEEIVRDPAAPKAAYEMGNDLAPDVPRVDPFTPAGFGFWEDWAVDGPHALPEAYFLAKDGDRYVAQSNLERNETLKDVLYTGFTGVRREYRGRGIAFALKLRAIDYAMRHGIREIRTWNSTLNAPMLGINVKLGFVKQPVWITLGKDLVEGS